MEVGTNPKGLLPQETQMPRLTRTAHGPAATREASTYPPTLFSHVKKVPSDPDTHGQEACDLRHQLLCSGEPEDKPSWLFPQDNLSSLEADVGAATQPASTGCLAQVPGRLLQLSPPKEPEDETGKLYFALP